MPTWNRPLALSLIALLMLTAPTLNAQPAPTSPSSAAGELTLTNRPEKMVPAAPAKAPLPAATKRRAGLMAGAGLAILSLLALAAGLALVRTFKR